MKRGNHRTFLNQINSAAVVAILLFSLAGCGQASVASTTEAAKVEASSGSQQVNETTVSDSSTSSASAGVDQDLVGSGTSASGDGTNTGALSDTNSVTLVMVGDILMHDPIEKASKRDDGTYDYSAVFANMKDTLSAADLALVNEEVIIGGKSLGITGYPCFNADFSLADELVDSGFDVILHATNHALDKGGAGITNCLNYWDSTYPDIQVLGIHDSAEDQQEICVVEKNGIKIAILNYTYGTNGISLPSGMPYGVDYLSEERVLADIDRAETMADFTIVCPHWGIEYQLSENSSQRALAEKMAAHGADLIIGTHPHVVEPIAWVTADSSTDVNLIGDGAEVVTPVDSTPGEMDGCRYNGVMIGGESTAADALAHRGQTLTYYSLGNFVSWTSSTGAGVTNRMFGGMASLTISMDADGAYVSQYGVLPVVSHLTEGQDGVTVYPLYEYTDDMASENAILPQDPSFSREQMFSVLEQVF